MGGRLQIIFSFVLFTQCWWILREDDKILERDPKKIRTSAASELPAILQPFCKTHPPEPQKTEMLTLLNFQNLRFFDLRGGGAGIFLFLHFDLRLAGGFIFMSSSFGSPICFGFFASIWGRQASANFDFLFKRFLVWKLRSYLLITPANFSKTKITGITKLMKM